jgi:hypothetical protein
MGEELMRAPAISMAAVTGRYLGKSFAELPCLELVCRIYRDDLGVEFPEAFEGVTRDDFLERWRQERKGLESLMLRFFRTLGQPADPRRPKRWDLLACMGRGGAIFPAVYVGRRHCITSTLREGVVIGPISAACDPIMARRLI